MSNTPIPSLDLSLISNMTEQHKKSYENRKTTQYMKNEETFNQLLNMANAILPRGSQQISSFENIPVNDNYDISTTDTTNDMASLLSTKIEEPVINADLSCHKHHHHHHHHHHKEENIDKIYNSNTIPASLSLPFIFTIGNNNNTIENKNVNCHTCDENENKKEDEQEEEEEEEEEEEIKGLHCEFPLMITDKMTVENIHEYLGEGSVMLGESLLFQGIFSKGKSGQKKFTFLYPKDKNESVLMKYKTGFSSDLSSNGKFMSINDSKIVSKDMTKVDIYMGNIRGSFAARKFKKFKQKIQKIKSELSLGSAPRVSMVVHRYKNFNTTEFDLQGTNLNKLTLEKMKNQTIFLHYGGDKNKKIAFEFKGDAITNEDVSIFESLPSGDKSYVFVFYKNRLSQIFIVKGKFYKSNINISTTTSTIINKTNTINNNNLPTTSNVKNNKISSPCANGNIIFVKEGEIECNNAVDSNKSKSFSTKKKEVSEDESEEEESSSDDDDDDDEGKTKSIQTFSNVHVEGTNYNAKNEKHSAMLMLSNHKGWKDNIRSISLSSLNNNIINDKSSSQIEAFSINKMKLDSKSFSIITSKQFEGFHVNDFKNNKNETLSISLIDNEPHGLSMKTGAYVFKNKELYNNVTECNCHKILPNGALKYSSKKTYVLNDKGNCSKSLPTLNDITKLASNDGKVNEILLLSIKDNSINATNISGGGAITKPTTLLSFKISFDLNEIKNKMSTDKNLISIGATPLPVVLCYQSDNKKEESIYMPFEYMKSMGEYVLTKIIMTQK